jgi:hypothetical protein
LGKLKHTPSQRTGRRRRDVNNALLSALAATVLMFTSGCTQDEVHSIAASMESSRAMEPAATKLCQKIVGDGNIPATGVLLAARDSSLKEIRRLAQVAGLNVEGTSALNGEGFAALCLTNPSVVKGARQLVFVLDDNEVAPLYAWRESEP